MEKLDCGLFNASESLVVAGVRLRENILCPLDHVLSG